MIHEKYETLGYKAIIEITIHNSPESIHITNEIMVSSSVAKHYRTLFIKQ